jgi:hypothetical protein
MIGSPDYPAGEFHIERHDFSHQVDARIQRRIVDAVRDLAVSVNVDPNITGSCEDPRNLSTRKIFTVPTEIIHTHEAFQPLVELYRGPIFYLARQAYRGNLLLAESPKNYMNINIQYGHPVEGREVDGYDAHADLNALSALWYAIEGEDDFDPGELVMALNPYAMGVQAIDEDCILVQPRSGEFVIANGRFPHYVRPSRGEGYRVAAAMNYYSAEYPETMRPDDVAGYSEGAL